MPLKKQQNHKAVLGRLPQELLDEWERVQVEDEFGKTRWRDRDTLAKTDVIKCKKNGFPIIMKGSPGRNKKPKVIPINDKVLALIQKKEEVIQSDPILAIARRDPDSTEVLHQVILGLGTEAASLGFLRNEMERTGDMKQTASVSSKRVQALKSVAETWLRRKDQIGSKSMDPDSPGAQAYARFLLETIREAMASVGLRPEMVETVFAKISTMVGDSTWDAEVRARIKKAAM